MVRGRKTERQREGEREIEREGERVGEKKRDIQSDKLGWRTERERGRKDTGVTCSDW